MELAEPQSGGLRSVLTLFTGLAPDTAEYDRYTSGVRPTGISWLRGVDTLQGGDLKSFERITHDPLVMGGKPCIRGMRITVGMIVGMIGCGHSIESLLGDYPYLEREDVLQALRYAAWRAEEREVEFARH